MGERSKSNTIMLGGHGRALPPKVSEEEQSAQRRRAVRYVASSSANSIICAELLEILGLDAAEGLAVN